MIRRGRYLRIDIGGDLEHDHIPCLEADGMTERALASDALVIKNKKVHGFLRNGKIGGFGGLIMVGIEGVLQLEEF